MCSAKVSVIIPTYNGAVYLGAAIQSVLAQTYPDFELIVVNDASPDSTTELLGQFTDKRIKYIVHGSNCGPDVARYTALQASSGEIVAFLDQDDLFHPDKLRAHLDVFDAQPAVGFTYNDRFELNYSSESIRDIWRAPRNMTLADLVLWFPLSPSDVLMRREWAAQMDLLSGSRGAEISHFGRLFLAGCNFACVGRALNYRRYHSQRTVNDLKRACESEIQNQIAVLSDPRCPPNVVRQKNTAHANLYIYWAYRAFYQGETAIGQEFLGKAQQLKPSVIAGKPCELVRKILVNAVDDENLNHESVLRSVFSQLPYDMRHLWEQLDWATKRGYLIKGARAVIWNRPEEGGEYFGMAARLGAPIDDSFLIDLTHSLLSYEKEFGADAVTDVLHRLTPYLVEIGGRGCARRLQSNLAFDRAFQRYLAGEYDGVTSMLLRAVANNPRYLSNKGALSVFIHAMFAKHVK